MAAFPARPAPPAPPPGANGSVNTVFVTQIRFDPSYVKSPAGILKIIVLVLNFMSFISIATSPFNSNGRGIYFYVVCILGFFFSGGLLMLYLYHVVEKYHNIKWLRIEMIGCVVLLFLYLIAATVAVGFGSPHYSAAGFFGYLSMMVYGADAFLKARAVRAGALAQGRRELAKRAPAAATP